MDQQKVDQVWQQLQSHIESFLDQALRNDAQRTEYRPQFIAQLLEMSSDSNQDEREEMNR